MDGRNDGADQSHPKRVTKDVGTMSSNDRVDGTMETTMERASDAIWT